MAIECLASLTFFTETETENKKQQKSQSRICHFFRYLFIETFVYISFFFAAIKTRNEFQKGGKKQVGSREIYKGGVVCMIISNFYVYVIHVLNPFFLSLMRERERQVRERTQGEIERKRERENEKKYTIARDTQIYKKKKKNNFASFHGFVVVSLL